MNDMPGACQSRTVTEPQRERSRLKLNYSHQKRLLRLFDEHSEIFVKFCFTKISRVLKRAKKSQNFFDTLKKQARRADSDKDNSPCKEPFSPMLR
ncbi:MAG: hypothetical protein ACLU3G_06395 [Christensenellales bacterium]